MALSKTFNQKILKGISQTVRAEDGPKRISGCAQVLLEAASFGKPKEKDLINAGVAAEFFYQAIYSHYWPGKGVGADIIMGDYYGSLAIVCAGKTKDSVVLEAFCCAIQEATKSEDDKNKAAGRLAKIYGASAYVGAYLAGLSGKDLDDTYKEGEKKGLEILHEKSAIS
jgi:hypothetical protein